jgi:hypothetical protein
MIYKDLQFHPRGLYTQPESELLDLETEDSFLESGQLGGVGEGDPGEDEWFN